MPLVDFDLPDHHGPVPAVVRSFLREAGRRVERFQRTGRAPGFVGEGGSIPFLADLQEGFPGTPFVATSMGEREGERIPALCHKGVSR